MSRPEKKIWPLRASMAPATPRRLVVLPAPLAPMRVTISPSATSKGRSGAAAGTRLQPDEREQRARFLAEAPGIAVNEIFPQRHVLMDVEAGEHVLEQRELLEEADLLEGASDAEPHAAVRRQADQACLFKMQGSRIGLVEARQQVEQRRLAGAVRPDQREDRFFRHADRNVLHRAHAADALADLLGPQNHRTRARNVIHAWTMPPGMNASTSERGMP